MASAKDLPENSHWPARLLHVDSLTSYPWQEGDIYGDYTKPRYNAISYTWGRFAIQDKSEYPDVKPMPILNTTWENFLPRMNPERFSTQEMSVALKTAACPYPGYQKVEFIWLDIACIDQTPNSPQNAREVGRQAKIFRGAQDTFAWLTTLYSSTIVSWAHEMDQLMEETGSINESTSHAAVLAWLERASDVLEKFISDEWFSSLWTLQEAFLSPKAVFIFRDGFPSQLLEMSRNGGGRVELFRLDMWIQTWNSIKQIVDHFPHYPEATKLSDEISRVGFLDGARNQSLTYFLDDTEYPPGIMGNPFKLFVAAKHRKTSPARETDRVYGIMQVFDLCLGKADPEATRVDFTLDELQLQLAISLLEKYPLISQIMVQHEQCPKGRAWMISDAMSIPREGYQAWNHLVFGGQVIYKSKMETTLFQDEVRVKFSGPLSDLSNYVVAADEHFYSLHTRLLVDLRWTTEIQGYDQAKLSVDVRARLEWVSMGFSRVKILLLASLLPPERVDQKNGTDFREWGVGLLLAPEEVGGQFTCYSRVGVLIWDLGFMKSSMPTVSKLSAKYLHGDGHKWIDSDGVFG